MPKTRKRNVIGRHKNSSVGSELELPHARYDSLVRAYVILHRDLGMLELNFR
jgi:hypothetical protein